MIEPAFPNSAFVSAPERLVLRGGRWRALRIPVRYGRFDHPVFGRCLIDTGYSPRVTGGKRSFPLWLYSKVLNPQLTADALPARAPEIDTILLSHLHADHVSALKDYPSARIFADRASVAHFLSSSWLARTHKGCFRELLPDDLAARLTPFEASPRAPAPHGLGDGFDIFGDGSVLAVPLPGHMRGHTGFVFTGGVAPLLYAADADWLSQAILEDRSPGAPARFILDDASAAAETSDRIRTFVSLGGRLALCHDPEAVR
ncbi:MBL fold metallo-hydrolase [Hyphomonas sp. WL0036]|uniref:MBL fold metallo-hydrolase n=1 Tax=Hyphomonas sediminis TaxID=2866160 RepID=UPI001C8138AA|nr:MBL fold metallo-hydrolase [Hyphomonas sediminis]MBY9068046.1 MBL fold metallo-hydrolase [Hyphomonas sediminis]